MKENSGGCCYWWSSSRNNRRQSSWLHSTLEEMDQKTENMLDLLEEKCDSFSQRAEFFYIKRPQLIGMIEENYKAYRSLAEQFDRLKAQIRKNSPESAQIFNGLSCEAPLENPLGKQISVNGNLNKACEEFLRSREVGDSVNCNPKIKRVSDQVSVNMPPCDPESLSVSSFSDSEMPNHFGKPTETGNDGSIMTENLVEMEEESSLLFKQLTAKDIQVEHLKIKNNKLEEREYCKEKMSLVMQDRSLLQKELEIIIVENTKLGNDNENEVNVWDMNDLLTELYFIREENGKLQNENEINVQQLQILTEKFSNLQKENKGYKIMSLVLACANEKLQKKMCKANGESGYLKDEKKKAEVISQPKENLVLEQSFKMKETQNEQRVQELKNENEINEQKLQALTQIGRGNRRGKGEANAQVRNDSEMGKKLEKENSNLSKWNKIMSLASVDSQVARLNTSNARGQNEMCGANCQNRGTLPILQNENKNTEVTVETKQKSVPEQNFRIEKLQRQVFGLVTENAILKNDIEINIPKLHVPKENVIKSQSENTNLCTQSKNVEIILKEKEKLVMEQSLKIGALQSEVYELLDENRLEEIQVLERNEKLREAVRQLCFTLDALMDKNKRLQKALQKVREEGEYKTNNVGTRPSYISRWKKFLYTGKRIQNFSYLKARSFNCVAEEVR